MLIADTQVEKIKKIVGVAVNAPSGDNGQPWKFRIIKKSLEVILVKDADDSIFNFRETGSIFAHGALIMNIEIVASTLGYKTTVEYFPNGENNEITARIHFQGKNKVIEDPLYKSIKRRCTNRKFYSTKELDSKHKDTLLKAFSKDDNIAVYFLENLSENPDIIKILSYNDRLLFENKKAHNKIFSIINWTDEEEKLRRKGLFVKAMELNPAQVAAFRKFSSWNIMKSLNKLGISKLIAKQNQRLYLSSSAIGIVVINSDNKINFLNSGRKFQKLWLTATKNGLSIHPVTGIAYLINCVKAGETKHFSDSDLELIREAEKQINFSFNIKGQTIAMIFRVGYSDAPSAKSLKLPPNFI